MAIILNKISSSMCLFSFFNYLFPLCSPQFPHPSPIHQISIHYGLFSWNSFDFFCLQYYDFRPHASVCTSVCSSVQKQRKSTCLDFFPHYLLVDFFSKICRQNSNVKLMKRKFTTFLKNLCNSSLNCSYNEIRFR